MTHKERFQNLGVRPPKGVLLYIYEGDQGTSSLKLASGRTCNMQAGYRPVHVKWKDLDKCNVCPCLSDQFEAKRAKNKASRERKLARREERLAKGPQERAPVAPVPAAQPAQASKKSKK